MRVASLLFCLVAAAVAVYPEAPVRGASRTTGVLSSHGSTAEPPLLSAETIDGWVKIWCRRLGLADWKIETKIVRLSQLPKGTIANIHWSLPRRTATIKVLDSIDSTLPRTEIVRDTELSVVHELIHLSMAKLPLDSNDTELEEETVRRISAALVALDKGDADVRR